MAIETPTGIRLPPAREQPYWHTDAGERVGFQEVLAGDHPEVAVERHAEAICAIARAAARARLRGEGREARRLAHAAGRLCEEIVGLWPPDSWKPMR